MPAHLVAPGMALALMVRRGHIVAALGMTVQAASWPREVIETRLLPGRGPNTAQVLRNVL